MNPLGEYFFSIVLFVPNFYCGLLAVFEEAMGEQRIYR